VQNCKCRYIHLFCGACDIIVQGNTCSCQLTHDRSSTPLPTSPTIPTHINHPAGHPCAAAALLPSKMIALGLEGSANKLGIGLIQHPRGYGCDPTIRAKILSNIRHTFVSPPGTGFLPKDTALHHREWAVKLVKQALKEGGVSWRDVDCICYTRGTRTKGSGIHSGRFWGVLMRWL